MEQALTPFRPRGWVNRLVASRRFQALCARVPGLGTIARAEGRAIFDLMQGFVQSQVLMALVETRALHLLADRPANPVTMAPLLGMSPARAEVLLQAGAAMGLLRRKGDGYALSRRGAAFVSVPGLQDLVRHHGVLYRDLADPVAFFRGETDPALARFWPYVFGADGAKDPDEVARYSRLMADTQTLVAEEGLRHLSLRGVRHLMDVGGGTGAFLRAVRARHPDLALTLFDLPQVVAQAALPQDVVRRGGSFRDDPLPQGADAISLVRVLYDHADSTGQARLSRAFDALPAGGRLFVIEPMSGGAKPDPQTDVYFSVYTLAMETGRTRSAETIANLMRQAGFTHVSAPKTTRPYVCTVIEAVKPAEMGIST